MKGLITAATAEKSFKEPERVKLCEPASDGAIFVGSTVIVFESEESCR